MPSASKLDSKGCGEVGSGGAGGGFNGRTTLRPVFPERGCRGWKCHPGILFSKIPDRRRVGAIGREAGSADDREPWLDSRDLLQLPSNAAGASDETKLGPLAGPDT